MHRFEVHSNENACRKSGRLGLELVKRDFLGGDGGIYNIMTSGECISNVLPECKKVSQRVY